MLQNYINHIAFVIDRSGSMGKLSKDVTEVFDGQIKTLRARALESDQETRVSVYLFNDKVECVIFDSDVNKVPSLSKYYKAGGNTALIDATLKAIEDLRKTNQTYGDHAFLIYTLTDGEENVSNSSGKELSKVINSLEENWTLAVLVPNQQGVFEAKKYGFPANNIQVWETSSRGIEEAGEVLKRSYDTFYDNRAKGIRSTNSLFKIDTSKLKANIVKDQLEELQAYNYQLLPVHKDSIIQPFVESWTQRPYTKGSTYYLLTKPESIQAYKQICVQDKRNGKVYSGLNARQILNLPDYEIKVSPASYSDFDIFVQSTSVNRKLLKGTKVIVIN